MVADVALRENLRWHANPNLPIELYIWKLMQSLGWYIVRFDMWILNAGINFLCRMRKDQKQRKTRWPVKNISFKTAKEIEESVFEMKTAHIWHGKPVLNLWTNICDILFTVQYLFIEILITSFFYIYFQGNKISYSINSISFIELCLGFSF